MKSTRRVRSTTIFGAVMVLAILAIAGTALACGVRTPGYWKTHPETWPSRPSWAPGTIPIWIEGQYLTKAQALDYLLNPAPGDKSYTLFSHLVAVLLNYAAGTSINVLVTDGTFTAAVQWCQQHPPGSDVTGNSDAWKVGEPLSKKLDAYNNGLLGVPAED